MDEYTSLCPSDGNRNSNGNKKIFLLIQERKKLNCWKFKFNPFRAIKRGRVIGKFNKSDGSDVVKGDQAMLMFKISLRDC